MAILSIFIVAAKRLWSTRWLALANAVGLIVVVSLALSVPIYSDAVYHRILQQDVSTWGEHRRPPFSYMYRYVGGANAVEWSQVSAVDQFMQTQVPAMLGLPRQLLVRYFASNSFPVFSAQDAQYADQRQPVVWASVGFLSDFADHITLTEGSFPTDLQTDAPDEVMPVMMSKQQADKLGLQVGERFMVFDRATATKPEKSDLARIPVVVSGIWTPRDENDLYWYSDPSVWKEMLVTSEPNFTRRVAPQLKGQAYLSVWYMLFDGSGVRSGTVSSLLDNMSQVLTRATAVLPGVRLDQSPAEVLKRYQQTSSLLTVQLFAFSIPILILTFVFIALVAGLTVNNQRNEIAVLRSRGATVMQVVGISFCEALVLGGLALGASGPVGERIAQLVGQTRSFLDFAGLSSVNGVLPTALSLETLRSGLVTVGLAVLITTVPTFGAAGHTVVTYKQERARSLRPPWWQRMWLDVLIFIPAAYGTYLLQKQGSISVQQVAASATAQAAAGTADPFSNPLLFLVPMLAMIALSLFIIRLLPLLLKLLTWLLGLFPGASMLLAFRQLARSPSFYAAPILLLTLTLALATFTASLAATLDQSMYDQVRYMVGADMSLTESMDNAGVSGAATLAQDASLTDQDRAEMAAAQARNQLVKSMLPVSDHLQVQGVRGATRVGEYTANAQVGGQNIHAQYFGIDRLDFARVSYWRKDFADDSLGTLMNALASASDGVLVPDTVMARYALHIGDPILVRVSLKDGSAQLKLRVVGVFHRWPGWYPQMAGGTMLFVGNLDHLFDAAGYQTPYHVLLDLDDGAQVKQVARGVLEAGFDLVRYESVNAYVAEEQARPARQGLFGLLSVGFAASALMTVLGFFLYSVFSFRRRMIELGVLRAIGFSAPQTAAFLGWELLLLLGIGLGAGTGLGVLASRVYIPFMQVSTTPEASAVPFRVIIAWSDMLSVYGLFVALFVVALLVLVVLLSRMRVFQAVKLGESL
jgi:putative ABC transport system permease protein